MAKCDLCGGICKAGEMVQLREIFHVDGVDDICPDCGKWVNKLKDEMTLEIAPRLRDEILAKKVAPPVQITAARGWWQRILTPND